MNQHTRQWAVTYIADTGKSDTVRVKADGPRQAIRDAKQRRWPGLHAGSPRRTGDGPCVAVAYADDKLSARTGEIRAEVEART